MGRIIVSEFITLDGVFEDPGGSEGKEYGGWQRPLMGDDEGAFKFEELKSADALLLGRVTYDGFATAWPTTEGTGEFGELMNSLPKHVVSLTSTEFPWNNSSGLDTTDVSVAVRQLKDRYEKDILVAGSGQLVQTLLDNGLVDELRLMTYPLVLGQGRHLFDGAHRTSLRLITTQTFATGTILLTYGQAE